MKTRVIAILVFVCLLAQNRLEAQKNYRLHFFPDSLQTFGLNASWEPFLLQARTRMGRELPASYARIDLTVFERFKVRGLIGQAAAPDKLDPVISGVWGPAFGFGFDFTCLSIGKRSELHISMERRFIRGSYEAEVYKPDPSDFRVFRATTARGDVRSDEYALGIGFRGLIWKNIGIDFVPIEFVQVNRGVFSNEDLFYRNLRSRFETHLKSRNEMHSAITFRTQLNVFVQIAGLGNKS